MRVNYIQCILFFSLFVIVKCSTHKTRPVPLRKLVPTYSTAGMSAKPGFGICHLRKLRLKNTAVVLA